MNVISIRRNRLRETTVAKRIMDVGVGIGNELWAMSVDGSQFIKLTDVWGENRWAGGVLHPHFSRDGSMLAWTQRVENIPGNASGAWVIKIAVFVLDNCLPHLANLRTLKPWFGRRRQPAIVQAGAT